MTTLTPSTIRDADIQDVVRFLENQRAHSVDIVAPASSLRFKNGNLIIQGLDAVLDDEGVTDPNGTYAPTVVAHEGIADKLDIPKAYVLRLAAERPGLFDQNVNSLLRGQQITRPALITPDNPRGVEVIHEADPRSFLVRLLKGEQSDVGVMRALLSSRFRVMDSLDALLALLSGLRAAGVTPVISVDLTDRRMVVRVTVPEVSAMAETLLANYRSPYSGLSGNDLPVMWAGFVFSNSETGNGSWSLTPRIVAQICTNGYTITKDADRKVHLGGEQSDGVVEYSEETQQAALRLITLKTRDAVQTFLTPEYLTSAIEHLEGKAAKPVAGSEAAQVIKNVGQRLGFDKTAQKSILDFFLDGGAMTAGGLMHAATAFAQSPDVSADQRFEIESKATKILELV